MADSAALQEGFAFEVFLPLVHCGLKFLYQGKNSSKGVKFQVLIVLLAFMSNIIGFVLLKGFEC